MEQSILKLELWNQKDSSFRTVFKTKHGRTLFLSLKINGPDCTILDCFYTDRNQARTGEARYSARPKKLRTCRCSMEELLQVIETELDKHFYGITFEQSCQPGLSTEEYLQHKAEVTPRKYRFLIMTGDGEYCHGLPARLRTRLKTNLHRSVYVELAYYEDGRGVVRDCHYYDRKYKRQDVKITPPQLIHCFFPYSKTGILNLLNQELCCDFTHIIIADGIDLDSNTTPLCGAV